MDTDQGNDTGERVSSHDLAKAIGVTRKATGIPSDGEIEKIVWDEHPPVEWEPIKAQDPPFRPGDVVRLKSGGPQMVVTRCENLADVCFHNEVTGTFEGRTLLPFALVLVEPSEIKPVEKTFPSKEARAKAIWDQHQENSGYNEHWGTRWDNLNTKTKGNFMNAVNSVLDGNAGTP